MWSQQTARGTHLVLLPRVRYASQRTSICVEAVPVVGQMLGLTTRSSTAAEYVVVPPGCNDG